MTSTASLWATYELSFAGPEGGNPFQDVTLKAVFAQGERQVRVNGFYDGGGRYIVRFLPDNEGQWSWTTSSNAPALDGKNDWGKTGYGGPAPPIGRHRYFHKLYALDTVLPDLGEPTKSELLEAMEGHILAEAELIGTYQKAS